MSWRANPEDKRERLRKKRSDKLENNSKQLHGFEKDHQQAEQDKTTAEQAYNGVCVEIGDLERQKNSYDTEVNRFDQQERELGSGNYDDNMEWECNSQADRVQPLFDEDSRRLRDVEKEISDKKRERQTVESKVDSLRGRYTDKAKREKRAAETQLIEINNSLTILEEEEADLKERLRQHTSTLNAATANRRATEQAREDRETNRKKRDLCLGMRMETEQKLSGAKLKKIKLETKLSEEKRRVTPIENRIETLKNEIKQRDMQDRTKHANIMMHVRSYLTTEDVDSFKSLLREYRVIGDGDAQRLPSFTDIWGTLCSKDLRYAYGIAVGNYINLRYLLTKIEKTKLAREVADLETKLLEEYEGEKTNFKFVQSNQTQQLKTLSQSVEAKVKVGEYEKLGGPCTYLQDVMVVIKYYLGQLSTEQKNESTDAVYEFVKQKLDRTSILSLVDTHAREQRSGKKKVGDLEKQLKDSETKCRELEAEIGKMKEKNDEDTRTYWEKFRGVEKKVKKGEDEIEKMKEKHKEQKDSAEKDWEVARKDLVAEKDKLRTEKEAADTKCTEMMRMMTEIRNEQTIRFKRLEADLTKVHDKKIAHYTAMMNSMMERHRQEMKEQRERYTKDTKELHECVEHYKDELERSQKKSTDALNDLRQEYHAELLDLENVYGESVVESEKERMELKQNLLVATMRKEFADHRLKMAKNDDDDDYDDDADDDADDDTGL